MVFKIQISQRIKKLTYWFSFLNSEKLYEKFVYHNYKNISTDNV